MLIALRQALRSALVSKRSAISELVSLRPLRQRSMDKNTLTGLLLMVALVIGYNYFFAPDPEPQDPPTELPQDASSTEDNSTPERSTAPDESTIATDPAVAAQNDSLMMARMDAENVARWGVFAPAAKGDDTVTSLENGRVKIDIAHKGGWFNRAVLQEGFHSFWDSTAIELFIPEKTSFDVFVDYQGKGKLNLSELYFTKESEERNDVGQRVVMRLNTSSSGSYIDYIYTLRDDSYVVDLQLHAVGMDRYVDLSSARLDWNAAGLHQEKGVEWERQHSSVFYREMGQGRSYLGESRDDDDEVEDPLNWVAFKQNFFSAVVIDREGFEPGAFLRSYPPKEESDTTVTMYYEARLPLALENTSNTMEDLEFYFGPNDLDELDKLEVEELGKIIDYGWWIFGWVNRNLIRPVFNWLVSVVGNIGIAIIIITILIKLLLSPVTWKNFVSSAKMRVLRPEIDEINEKHKDDSMAKQQATMALYRETGVNPFAGCLPMLLQLPILYAMFRFFPANIDMRGKQFLWADDLGAYDAIVTWTTEIPLISSVYGNHVSGFALMMAVSTFFYSRMSTANMPSNNQPGMPNMKVIMSLFPIITLVFFNRFAAGLNFYYFCANLISIIQMWVIKNYMIDEDKIHAKLQENKKKPKKKSSFQQRLEEMQKQQKDRAKQNQRKKK